MNEKECDVISNPPASEAIFVDIHCHLIPGIDDGAASWDETLSMAEIAARDGLHAILVTPHQCGTYAHNSPNLIRERTRELQDFLAQHRVDVVVLPGADVRIEDDLVERIQRDEILTLADRRRHVLLELPHELYFDLRGLVERLARIGIQAILSHPERNLGLLSRPDEIVRLVDHGCLMQVTAGSLMGTFGPASTGMAEWMLHQGLAHFLATDAHGPKTRRPRMSPAFQRATELVGARYAFELCCQHPASVSMGESIPPGRRPVKGNRPKSWFGRR
ncbi:MAG TPA: CpsB/CapC family capsule biosynthesis tyrosine phosphatase, partial [Pirellulaceae bacterium]